MSTKKKMTAAQKKFLAEREEYQLDRSAQLEMAITFCDQIFGIKAPSLTLALKMLDVMDESVDDDGEFHDVDFLDQLSETKKSLAQFFAPATPEEILDAHMTLAIPPGDDDVDDNDDDDFDKSEAIEE